MQLDDSLVRRFHEKVDKKSPDECWNWTGSLAGKGYGQMKLTSQRRQVYAHRVAFAISHGEVPEGKYVCHSCDNPKCCNPAHLWAGSHEENLRDMAEKGRSTWGKKNGRAVLTEESVQQIRKMLEIGIPQARIGLAFGVQQGTISKIALGHRWDKLKDDPECS